MYFLEKFFLYCSGSNLDILKKCPGEYNKYMGIGATVFFTGFFAFFAGAYALHTVFSSSIIAVLFGVVWGSMIFNLDRFIVSSMKKEGNFWIEFRLAFPRIILAILLAIIISKPLELKIFEPEINAELILMEQSIFKEQEDKVKARHQPRIDRLNKEIDKFRKEINVRTKKRDELQIVAQQEADGTGGSKRASLGPIFKIKKKHLDLAEEELALTVDTYQPLIDARLEEIKTIDTTLNSDLVNLERDKYNGLAARLYALRNISDKSDPINMANWFIMFLFMAIETAPLFVKLITSKGPYDDLLKVHEHTFAVFNLEQIAKLDHQAQEKIRLLTNRNSADNDALRVVNRKG
ncbi:MAG: DUF4407 domain-containing protein [Deltaproteobacteria bacterium]|nr:DUF4407 domain-containing protein [Deltaproteobacteria bacterium]